MVNSLSTFRVNLRLFFGKKNDNGVRKSIKLMQRYSKNGRSEFLLARNIPFLADWLAGCCFRNLFGIFEYRSLSFFASLIKGESLKISSKKGRGDDSGPPATCDGVTYEALWATRKSALSPGVKFNWAFERLIESEYTLLEKIVD